MIIIDGSEGEGGGQILRSSLSLSAITGQPFRIERIRARRRKPGLRRQHLTCVEAAAAICDAKVQGARVGADEVTFEPSSLHAGHYRFDIGTAGNACLVLQTVLPPLLQLEAPSRLVVDGGTHNPMSPPFDYLVEVFLPLLRRMGPEVTARIARHGFYPAGGGRIEVEVTPTPQLAPLELCERGAPTGLRARALLANLPDHIGQRELKVIERRLGLSTDQLTLVHVESVGPGNVLLISAEFAQVSEMFVAFGEKGVRAERVASVAVKQARLYLDGDAPVGPHLADQLLLPLALAGGGRFVASEITEHTRTNIAVVRRFVDVAITTTPRGGLWLIEVKR